MCFKSLAILLVNALFSISQHVGRITHFLKEYICNRGRETHQITGSKLTSNGLVLFYNIRELNLTVNESASLTIRECIIYWEKGRIPIKSLPNCVKKLVNLYQVWRYLQKNSNINTRCI